MNDFTFLKKHMELVDSIIYFFLSNGINNKLNETLVNRVRVLKQTNYRPWLDMGCFSKIDFITWFMDSEKAKSFSDNILNLTLKILCQKNLLFERNFSSDVVYDCNILLVEYFSKMNLIKNVMFGLNYSVNHFEKSIFKIEHIDNQRKHSIGTGFHFAVKSQDGVILSFIITNKHVVENAYELNLFNQDNLVCEYRDIITSDTIDLAAFILKEDLKVESFNFNEEPNILDDILTMGFPSVPMTRDSYLLCHKGEINAFVKDYQGNDHILISAKTSSGNSGGPIIDVTGRLVGIVTKEFFDEHQLLNKGKLPYYAGIISADIRSFLNEKVIPLALSVN
jgi:S1-C subfamily serine protease